MDATPLIVVGALVFVALVALAFYLLDQKARAAAAAAPRLRACPVCGKELTRDERILAERTGVVKEGREKILIKGCPHCLGPGPNQVNY